MYFLFLQDVIEYSLVARPGMEIAVTYFFVEPASGNITLKRSVKNLISTTRFEVSLVS